MLPFVGACFACWRAGQRLTWLNALVLIACCAAAPMIKLNGAIVPIVSACLLLIRALRRDDWVAFGAILRSRASRVAAAAAMCAGIVIACWLMLWASYAFRYAPTPAVNTLFDFDFLMRLHPPALQTTDPAAYWKTKTFVELMLWIDAHRLAPQAWVYQMIWLYLSRAARSYYLLGQISDGGWWYYFPVAYLVKTPLTLLAICALAPVALKLSRISWGIDRWTGICLGLPLVLFVLETIASSPDQGLRYLLPAYPFLYLLIAVAAARLWERFGSARIAIVAALVVLAIETLSAFPNFIPYFNLAAGGSRGGLRILGDSNLDWGQGLAELARWRAQHNDRQLYLCYFGAVDPAFYGIDCRYFPGSFPGDRSPSPLQAHCYVAVSATHLQGIYLPPRLREFYASLAQRAPMAVIAGSIYVYEID
jgi:hypothetical protein